MESLFKNIDPKKENNIFHEYYMNGYYKGVTDGTRNMMDFLCKLSNEEIINWINFFHQFPNMELENDYK